MCLMSLPHIYQTIISRRRDSTMSILFRSILHLIQEYLFNDCWIVIPLLVSLKMHMLLLFKFIKCLLYASLYFMPWLLNPETGLT